MSADKILIIGAGEAASILLKEFAVKGFLGRICCLVDDDISKKGTIISGKEVIGGKESISSAIKEFKISHVIIALPSAGSSAIKSFIDIIYHNTQNINVQILPAFAKYFSGHLANELQSVQLNDIIKRDEVKIDPDYITKYCKNKTVLVTGAGGSIGSELCRQLLRFDVKRLICLGKGENSIYQLAKSLKEIEIPGIEIEYLICDVRNEKHLDRIFKKYSPDIVFHAAAHKHVPLMEFNESEAAGNNIGGTLSLLKISHKHAIQSFIMISSDKAVNPANFMGATKRVCELITLYYSKSFGLKSSAVRFGNVIGSRGSVIPLFKEQIERGGPVTVTDPEIKRYFMSIPEASLLVLNAAAFSKGGEIFVLDMGDQYKIKDIAESMIRQYGLIPDTDIKIKYTGLRPGEKLYEELAYEVEKISITPNGKIMQLDNEIQIIDENKIKFFIEEILPFVYDIDSIRLREEIRKIVPGFVNSDNGTNRKIVF